MYNLYCRSYQLAMRGVASFLSWRMPELIEGAGSVNKLAGTIQEQGISSVLLVTDRTILSLGLIDSLLVGLEKNGVSASVYSDTVANPTIGNIEEALRLYIDNGCQAIIGFGGGSAIDCAKGVGARVARPDRTIVQMKGQLKVKKPIPPLFAVPTTAGTGSEATLAAVVSDPDTHHKYVINDPVLFPHVAVLDASLTLGLPPNITATTGMDALTHAVEAYIGRGSTEVTRPLSREAVRMIFQYLPKVFADGSNAEAREAMLLASYKAGTAFTRAYVGYVHAMAHALGGLYGTPHGLANAIILPFVLDYYGKSVNKSLAELADEAGLGERFTDMGEKAAAFIAAIRGLNENMGIPSCISSIREEDIPFLAKRAIQEANPLYPVPRLLNRSDIEVLFRSLKG
ncbi:iron-containing alcohol dehydrogenase [Paenibacillus herberti]|uniref:Alcohol dehydrogenase n=1 Tax=Paenibacillus herberti TaxID=1619309 RepID=A0A229P1T4_9BACL|nr:iron-containing alcohol dehydrogenase [Paenibacillus herberti]OXM15889.1 alcohol dehydrogenase [Paenibacillus herberti]